MKSFIHFLLSIFFLFSECIAAIKSDEIVGEKDERLAPLQRIIHFSQLSVDLAVIAQQEKQFRESGMDMTDLSLALKTQQVSLEFPLTRMALNFFDLSPKIDWLFLHERGINLSEERATFLNVLEEIEDALVLVSDNQALTSNETLKQYLEGLLHGSEDIEKAKMGVTFEVSNRIRIRNTPMSALKIWTNQQYVEDLLIRRAVGEARNFLQISCFLENTNGTPCLFRARINPGLEEIFSKRIHAHGLKLDQNDSLPPDFKPLSLSPTGQEVPYKKFCKLSSVLGHLVANSEDVDEKKDLEEAKKYIFELGYYLKGHLDLLNYFSAALILDCPLEAV